MREAPAVTDDQFDRLIVELAKANFALARIAAAHLDGPDQAHGFLDAQHEHGEQIAAALVETRPPAPLIATSAPPPPG
jgi:hypothetical protein